MRVFSPCMCEEGVEKFVCGIKFSLSEAHAQVVKREKEV